MLCPSVPYLLGFAVCALSAVLGREFPVCVERGCWMVNCIEKSDTERKCGKVVLQVKEYSTSLSRGLTPSEFSLTFLICEGFLDPTVDWRYV